MKGVKDVLYCPRRNHIVPREQMTTVLSDDGKKMIRACAKCREEILEARAQRKKGVK